VATPVVPGPPRNRPTPARTRLTPNPRRDVATQPRDKSKDPLPSRQGGRLQQGTLRKRKVFQAVRTGRTDRPGWRGREGILFKQGQCFAVGHAHGRKEPVPCLPRQGTMGDDLWRLPPAVPQKQRSSPKKLASTRLWLTTGGRRLGGCGASNSEENYRHTNQASAPRIGPPKQTVGCPSIRSSPTTRGLLVADQHGTLRIYGSPQWQNGCSRF